MDFSIRTATPAEQMYSYSQSGQIEAQTGCIGHLRADFGSDGNSFYSSWADHNASLKDQAFKDEFDHLINTLRGLDAAMLEIPVRRRHREYAKVGRGLAPADRMHRDFAGVLCGNPQSSAWRGQAARQWEFSLP